MIINQHTLTAKTLHEWLTQHKVIPKLPDVLVRLDSLLNDPNVTVAKVADLLAADVAVGSSIMKAVGAMRYVTIEPVTTITDAVKRLGFEDIRVIAYTSAFMSRIAPTPHISQRRFWTSAFVSAVAAREVAIDLTKKGLGKFDAATAFLLGLSHDIGMLVLDAYLPHLYQQVISQSYFNPSALSRHEKETLGLNHGIAGAVLMKYWGFPESWVMAVAGHSFPARLPKEFQSMADLLLVAESMAFYLGYHNGVCRSQKAELIPELVLQRLQHMHFNAQDCCSLADRVNKALQKEGWLDMAAQLPDH